MNIVQIGDCTLYHADCREVLPTLAPGSVDAVVTDPPYGIKIGAAFVRKGGRVIGNGKGFFNEAYSWDWVKSLDFLIPGGNVAAFHRREDCLPPPIVTWHRFYLVKSAPPPTPRRVFVSAVEECTVGRKPGGFRWFGSGYEPNYWLGLTPNRLNNAEHESQKPIEAMETLVRCLSGRCETILDPFMGSGTTGVACVRLGRKFLGCEIEEKYFDIACKRIAKAYDEKASPLFGEQPPKPQQLNLLA